MNISEKKRAEQLVRDWSYAHPFKRETYEGSSTTPKAVLDIGKQIKSIEQQIDELQNTVKELKTQSKNKHGWTITENYNGKLVYQEQGNSEAQRAVHERNRVNEAQREAVLTELIAGIWDGKYTFETLMIELEKVAP